MVVAGHAIASINGTEFAMTETTEISLVLTDKRAAADLRAELAGITGEEPLLIERRGLDGATAAALIMLVTTAIDRMPVILDALGRFLTRNSVEEIEITDHGVRIVRPRSVDLANIGELRRPAGGPVARQPGGGDGP